MLAQLDSRSHVPGEKTALGDEDSVLGDIGRVGLWTNIIVSFLVDDGGLVGIEISEKIGGGGTE